jgi:nicotinate-nucleotide adenylyltransferase
VATAKVSRLIGVLGGTFDPIHNAHLRCALEMYTSLGLTEVRFVPSAHPPHRGRPVASTEQRLAMLDLAIAGQAGFVIDDREARRPGPSFMVDTLLSLRAEIGSIPLCLLLGMDAFQELHGWHRWQEIPELAHMVVLHRPGASLSLAEALGDFVGRRKLHHVEELAARASGGILFQPVTQLDISASGIRALRAAGNSPRYLLPETVMTYIERHGLYRHS